MITITDLQIAFGLSPQLARMLEMLLDNKIVTNEMIDVGMGIDYGDDGLKVRARRSILIHRLRKALEVKGLEITSRRSVGFWLDAATKDAVRRGVQQESLPLDQGGKDEVTVPDLVA